MRVIGGIAKGRRLKTARGWDIRPTSDYLKGVFFDILQRRVQDASFLDLFAGSGNVGIEAMSRGARGATFVDCSSQSMAVIRMNVAAIGLQDRAELMRSDVLKAIETMKNRGQKFSFIFIDPPYRSGLLHSTLLSLSCHDLLSEEGMIVVEHFHKEQLSHHLPGLIWDREIRHGESKLSFYLKERSSGEKDIDPR